jgi:hypothetical protein
MASRTWEAARIVGLVGDAMTSLGQTRTQGARERRDLVLVETDLSRIAKQQDEDLVAARLPADHQVLDREAIANELGHEAAEGRQ